MVATQHIRPNMTVVSSDHEPFACVESVEGSWIKLRQDAQGTHHYIPMGWVETIDHHGHLQLNRSAKQAMQQWSLTPTLAGLRTLPSCRAAITGRMAALTTERLLALNAYRPNPTVGDGEP